MPYLWLDGKNSLNPANINFNGASLYLSGSSSTTSYTLEIASGDSSFGGNLTVTGGGTSGLTIGNNGNAVNQYPGIWNTSLGAPGTVGQSYALIQSNTGETYLNAASGHNINFGVNNTYYMVMNASGLEMNSELNMNGNNLINANEILQQYAYQPWSGLWLGAQTGGIQEAIVHGVPYARRLNALRFYSPSLAEYYTGSAWSTWSGPDFTVLTDDMVQQGTNLTVDATHAKFRLTYGPLSAYEEQPYAIIVYGELWGASSILTFEDSPDGSTWTTRTTATISNNSHIWTIPVNGTSENGYYVRITIDLSSWLTGSNTTVLNEIELLSTDSESSGYAAYGTDVNRNFTFYNNVYITGTITNGTWNGSAISNSYLAGPLVTGLTTETAAGITLTASGSGVGAYYYTPSISVGGDLSGSSLASLTLAKIAGTTLTITSLATNDILQYNGLAWVNVLPTSLGLVNSVSNSDGTLTISPTTGAVVASLNLGHANSWTALQTFGTNISFMGAQLSGSTTSGGIFYYNGTNFVDANHLLWVNPTLELTASSSIIQMTGSSTGYTAIATANSSSSNYTATLPANTGTLAELNLAQSWSAAQTFQALTTTAGIASGAHALSSGSPYTVVSTDEVLLITTGSSAYTVDLPAASANTGRKLLIIKVDSGSGSVTVTPAGTDKINGQSSATLASQYNMVGLVADGVSAWYNLGVSGGGGGAVSSVSNSDGTLTISPTTGAVVASLALGHANTWTANQILSAADLILQSAAATSGTTLQNSPYEDLLGAYWNGSSSVPYGFRLYTIADATTPTAHISLNLNNNGTITELWKIKQDGSLQFDQAEVFIVPSGTATAWSIGDSIGGITFAALDTRTTTSGVATWSFFARNPTIASAAGVYWELMHLGASTITLTGTTAVTNMYGLGMFIDTPTITDSSSVTVTTASTFFVNGAPSATGLASITNPYSLYVNTGNSFFGGNVNLSTGYLFWTGSSAPSSSVTGIGASATQGNLILNTGVSGSYISMKYAGTDVWDFYTSASVPVISSPYWWELTFTTSYGTNQAANMVVFPNGTPTTSQTGFFLQDNNTSNHGTFGFFIEHANALYKIDSEAVGSGTVYPIYFRVGGNNAFNINTSGLTTFTSLTTTAGIASGAHSLSSGSPYSVVSTDEILLITTGSSAYTVDLPAASANAGRKLLIIKADSGTGSVTITPSGSDKINGSSSASLASQYNMLGIVSDGSSVWYNLAGSSSASVQTTVITSSQTYTTPTGAQALYVFCIGGGGGGGSNSSGGTAGGGGGGAGDTSTLLIKSPSSSYTVTIGGSGAGGTAAGHNGSNGGNTTFGSVVTALGGLGGLAGSVNTGGAGGTGANGFGGSGSGGQDRLAGGGNYGGSNGSAGTTGGASVNYTGASGGTATGGGGGGSSSSSQGGAGGNNGVAGHSASGYGGGGGGAGSGGTTGGAGGAGLCIVVAYLN